MDSRGHAPIACTLKSRSYQERLVWIARLARDGLLAISRNDLQIELTYAPSVAGRVREMFGREQECCSFLNFEMSETGQDVRLTITLPERAREVADSLFEPFVSPGRSAAVEPPQASREDDSGVGSGTRAPAGRRATPSRSGDSWWRQRRVGAELSGQAAVSDAHRLRAVARDDARVVLMTSSAVGVLC